MKKSLFWMMAIPACMLLILSSCGETEDETADGDAEAGPPVNVSGIAWSFALPGQPYGLMAGAEVSVLEYPDITTTTNDDGSFELSEVPSGVEVTFVIKLDGFPEGQTKTFILDDDLTELTFQIPPDDLFLVLAGVLAIEADDAKCQMVSTVTRVGKSIGDEGAHGEAGATVNSDPAIDTESGPVYFNDMVLPDRTVTATSEDGGVVYTNVPEGEYVLSASKAGMEFESVKMKCRPGVLVNASPPYGLQAQQAEVCGKCAMGVCALSDPSR